MTINEARKIIKFCAVEDYRDGSFIASRHGGNVQQAAADVLSAWRAGDRDVANAANRLGNVEARELYVAIAQGCEINGGVGYVGT